MNRRLYFPAAAFILISSLALNAFAQDETDALRYSQLQPQGTARSMGFGSALGSIGGDFSSLAVNPAGIGIYRTSEFMFTPSLKINGATGDYMGSLNSDNNTRFTFNNIGGVFTRALSGRRYERSDWKAYSFGLGINRLADFNRNYTYGGFNNTSSGAEVFAIDANNYPDDIENLNTLAGLGYQSYLTDFDAGSNSYVVGVPYSGGLNQLRTVEERGGISEFNISFGGNYKEMLMLGATLGIPNLRYTRKANYTEADASGNNDNGFDSYTYSETLTTKGSGINLKLGLIFKPNDAFRMGVAYHTPTAFSLNEEYDNSVTSNTEFYKEDLGDFTGPITTVASDKNIYDYSLTTPGRFIVSASGIFSKYGFITGDFEVVNYAGSKFSFSAATPADEAYVKALQNNRNNAIKNSYKTAFNARLGAEGRMDNFMGRLGLGYYGSPYKTGTNGQRLNLSAGVGMRFDYWYIDLGYVLSLMQEEEHPYVLDYGGSTGTIAPLATINSSQNNVALTVGFKW